MGDHEYHLLDPSEYQLHVDPSLGAGIPGVSPFPPSPAPGGYNMGAGMVDDFYHSNLFPQPSFTPGGGPPGANFDLFQHYTETPAAPSPFQMPTLPFGLEADKDGVGGTLGDWSMRFMPIIPGLNDPDAPDVEAAKKQHEIPDPLRPTP